MKKDFPPTSPLPFKDFYEITSFTQEHALGDVVESAPPPRPGLYVDDVDSIQGDERYRALHDDDHVGHHVSDRRDNHHHDDRAAPSSSAETSDEPEGNCDQAITRPRGDECDDSPDGSDGDNDPWTTRRRLLERDRFERQLNRERERRERRERRAQRAAQRPLRRRRYPARRSRDLDSRRQRTDRRDAQLPGRSDPRADAVRDWRPRGVSSNDQPHHDHHLTHVAAPPHQLKRTLATRTQGGALVLYFALLPYVVYSKWHQVDHDTNSLMVHVILVLLIVFWFASLCQVLLNVRRLRRGRRVKSGASAWLAGLVVALLALIVPTPHAPHEPIAMSVAYRAPASRGSSSPRRMPVPLSGAGAVPLALMAKRRNDFLREPSDDASEFDVDESIELLRGLDANTIGHLATLAGDRPDGVLDVADHPPGTTCAAPTSPIVACLLGPSATGTLVGFAREGGRLPVRPSWNSDDLERNIVALHDGRVLFVRSEPELLRALATRTLRQSVVVYLGPSNEMDDELAACTITVRPYLERADHSEGSTLLVAKPAPHAGDLRVEFLRADPQVVGLVEAFTPTLRRRCVEMVAYLALHRHEPVTGERLRTRVLAHADVDASLRTLANTASAVRRSLGVDAQGPRLHPVSSSGLYVTHGLSSDVELFSTLVARARQLPVADASSLAHQALLLIKGEPLASALRGFEWFLAEGHGARLARDGEWAALVLHHASLERGNYELAFWSLQQGLLIDPYSDALGEALSRVPRLRQFGGDGSRTAQHRSVGARGAVAMSWSFARFTQQVFQ
jgi:hypothetical protein